MAYWFVAESVDSQRAGVALSSEYAEHLVVEVFDIIQSGGAPCKGFRGLHH